MAALTINLGVSMGLRGGGGGGGGGHVPIFVLSHHLHLQPFGQF